MVLETSDLQRKPAVILHAGVVNPETLEERNEELAQERIATAFARFSSAIESQGGVVHKVGGNARVAEFERASDAVHAALAFQSTNSEHNKKLNDDIRPELRVGISIGQLTVANGTVTGAAVERAQNVGRLAESGGVCITEPLHDALLESVPLDRESLDEEEVRVFAIRLRDGAPGRQRKWLLAPVAIIVVLLLSIVLWPAGGDVVCEVVPPQAAADTDGEHPEAVAVGGEGSGTDLVVLLHAFKHKSADLAPVRDVVAKEMPTADTLTCDLPFGLLSTARPEDVLAQLLSEIDRAWEAKKKKGDPYSKVRLVGHSMGALFARKAYVVAAGENPRTPFDPDLKERLAGPKPPECRESRPGAEAPFDFNLKQRLGAPGPPGCLEARPWAPAVERIVLLAGMNRGWSISHHMSLSRAVFMSVGVALGELRRFVYGRPPIILEIRRGAPFITQLRIQWLEMRRQVDEGLKRAGGATTVQLLGSVDDLVSPEDNIDLVSGRDFFYLDVPWSGHANVIEMKPEAEEGSPAKARADQFAKALTWKPKQLEKEQVLPVDMALDPLCAPRSVTEAEPANPASDALPPAAEVEPAIPARDASPPVTDVLFVIHGIRDEGYWTQKIARRVISKAREEGRCVVSETSSYGYFPMLSFLSSRARREKVEWLMDRYTEAKARYPDATFHYVGHSNGTYLLAKALKEYPSCRFDRVVFAGSVVRTDYDWADAVNRNQIGAVLNFMATGDWVVAFFPKALQLIDWQDLGSAGHDGFDSGAIEPRSEQGKQYVVGDHSAALQEALWDAIAEFVVLAEVPEDFPEQVIGQSGVKFEPGRVGWIENLGEAAPFLWLVLAVPVAVIFYVLIKLPLREWVRTLIIVGYLVLIWIVLTRV